MPAVWSEHGIRTIRDLVSSWHIFDSFFYKMPLPMPRKSKKPNLFSAAAETSKRALQFDDQDLLGQLTAHEGSTLWLGRFTVAEIQYALEQCGIFAALREKRLDNFIIKIEPFEEFDQALRIYCHAATPENLIAEARFREVRFIPQVKMPETFSEFGPKMLKIEWLLMQNPFATFSPERLPLPAQTHPGLGQARRVTHLLMDLCRKHHLAGIVNFPEFFHNAYLYRDYFHFYDPEREGNICALQRDLLPLDLGHMSWAIEAGCVRCKQTGERFTWASAQQVLPVHAVVKDYFASAWYRQHVQYTLGTQSFFLDEKDFQKFLTAAKNDSMKR